jgi:hypothetical protein
MVTARNTARNIVSTIVHPSGETVTVDVPLNSTDSTPATCNHIAPLATIVVNGSKTSLTAFRKCPMCPTVKTPKAPKSKTTTDAAKIAGQFMTPAGLNEVTESTTQNKWWSKRGKDAMEDTFAGADTRNWTMANPPRILTIALRPKRREDFIEHFPEMDKSINKLIDALRYHYESFWGEALQAMILKEFDENEFPHLHVLMVTPDGLSNGPTGKGAKYAHLNNLEFWEWLEMIVGELTGLDAKTFEDGTAKITWVPQDDQMGEPQTSIAGYVKVFIIYARKEINEELRAKARTQHKYPSWYVAAGVRRVNWFYSVGFEQRSDVLAAKAIYTEQGLQAVRNCLHEFAGSPVRQYTDMTDKSTGEIVAVDTSYYSNERHQPRGGTLRGALTDEQLNYLCNLIDFHNEVDPLDRAAQAARLERREIRRETRGEQ